MRRRFLIAAACALMVGCGGRTDTPNPFETASSGGGEIEIRVENLNFNDATLHALADGTRLRMGRVSGKSNASFRVDWPFVRDLSIEISLLASSDYTTRRITVSPGESVRLMIQTPVNRSFIVR